MNFNIVEMDDLTGRMAHIYSILPKGEEFTLLEQFFEEIKQYKKESTTIIEKLTIMGNETGCRRGYFKHYEGALGDGVAALSVGCIRLYCLYFDKRLCFSAQEDISHQRLTPIRKFQNLARKRNK